MLLVLYRYLYGLERRNIQFRSAFRSVRTVSSSSTESTRPMRRALLRFESGFGDVSGLLGFRGFRV